MWDTLSSQAVQLRKAILENEPESILSTPSFLNLLQKTHAPQSLKRIYLVLNNLPSILGKISTICQDARWRWVINISSGILPATNALLAPSAQKKAKKKFLKLTYTYDFFEDPKLSSYNANFHSLKESNPLYCSLGHLPEKEKKLLTTDKEAYHQLQAQVLIAVWTLEKAGIFDAFINSTKGQAAFRSVRDLCSPEYHRQYLQLPTLTLPPEKYVQAIQDLSSQHIGRRILVLLEQTCKLNQQQFEEERRAESTLEEPGKEGADDDEIEDLPQVTNLPPEDEEEDDLPGGELEQGKDYVEVEGPDTGDRDLNRKISVSLGHQIKNRMQKDHQFFSFAWAELNQHDLAILLNYLEPAHQGVPSLDSTENLVAKGFFTLMLFAARTFEQTTTLSTIRLDQLANEQFHIALLEPVMETTLYWSSHTVVIRIPSEQPILSNTYIQEQGHQSYAVQKHIDLRLPWFAAATLRPLLEQLSGGRRTATFTQITDAKRICTAFLSYLKRKERTRLTPKRITNYLPRSLARLPGADIAYAQLTFGTDDHLARTRVHYTSVDADSLKMFYDKACSSLMNKTGRKAEPIIFKSQSKHLGSPVRPRWSHLKKVIEHLQTDLENARPQCIEQLNDQVIHFHNLFTTYCSWLLIITTGYRKSKNLSLLAEQIDPMTGSMVIRDKDTGDNYHVRMLYLPELVQQQLTAYQGHLDTLHHHHFFTDLNIGQTFASGKRFGRIVSFFHLNHQRQIIPINSAMLAEHLQVYGHTLPMNAQRQLLKNEFQERGCCIEVVEALLGHWSMGQEPFAKTSSLHPEHYRQELEKHLPILLKNLGFRPIAGLGEYP